MTISIYRIHVYSEGSNSHLVSRSERWEVKHEEDCETREEAERIVREKSRQYTELPKFLVQWKETKACDRTKTEQQVINEFCFENDLYLKYRRIFIGKPDLKKIKNELKQEGVEIIQLK